LRLCLWCVIVIVNQLPAFFVASMTLDLSPLVFVRLRQMIL